LASLSFALFIATLSIPLAYAEQTSTLGVINERPERPDHALNQFGLLNQYLADVLKPHGISVQPLVVMNSIAEMKHQVRHKEVDALIEGVMPTFMIVDDNPDLEPTLLVWRKGQRQYYSVFFARKDSDINSLNDLGGAHIAFESERSTSAYFIPKLELEAHQVSVLPEGSDESGEVLHYQFAGSELNQAYWVHQGKVDVAAFNNGDWERVPAKLKEDLKIIHKTKPILRWLLSMPSHVDEEVKAALINALLNSHLDEAGKKALAAASKIAKFESLTESDLANLDYWKALSKD
jgi:phosphonate transport system substrate-binding protein